LTTSFIRDSKIGQLKEIIRINFLTVIQVDVKTATPVTEEDMNQAILILAAGLGKRMKSALPKVLHEVGGSPMLCHILRSVQEVSPEIPVAIVVGYAREKVEETIRTSPEFSSMDITFIHQPEQRGTGHAARCAMDSEWGEERVRSKSAVVVLPGDLPLMPAELVRQMVAPLGKTDAMRLLTCDLPDPTGYGRVVRRGKSGPVLRIVEQKDATARERLIPEVAASIYSFQAGFLRSGLQRLSTSNAQGEYYLTDLVAQAARAKKRIDILKWTSAEDLRGVNDPWELAQAGKILNERYLKGWAVEGVRFIDPSATWVDGLVKFEGDAIVYPGALLQGRTIIGAGTVIGPGVVLKDVVVGKNVHLKTGTVAENSRIEDGAQLGPYAHLRPESQVGAHAKIGNFVELKKARIGEKTSVAHLSYLGDAEVGRGVNIGCGFVTCNFDGRVIDGQRKHRTVIEDEAFIGSDCQTVAPVRIGKGAYVASGSTITEDVEAEALAIARSRQVTKSGYARKLRQK
jgi:bifunctional UDP-N-acetylglucosamine pyrophosphorylase/glucosamine-1-phosphate N-acetyltransferase